MLRPLFMFRSYRALVPLFLVARVAVVALVVVALIIYLRREEPKARSVA